MPVHSFNRWSFLLYFIVSKASFVEGQMTAPGAGCFPPRVTVNAHSSSAFVHVSLCPLLLWRQSRACHSVLGPAPQCSMGLQSWLTGGTVVKPSPLSQKHMPSFHSAPFTGLKLCNSWALLESRVNILWVLVHFI